MYNYVFFNWHYQKYDGLTLTTAVTDCSLPSAAYRESLGCLERMKWSRTWYSRFIGGYVSVWANPCVTSACLTQSWQNFITFPCTRRKLCLGSLGNKWWMAWNCSPPWNQSIQGGHSISLVVRSCYRERKLPKMGGGDLVEHTCNTNGSIFLNEFTISIE